MSAMLIYVPELDRKGTGTEVTVAKNELLFRLYQLLLVKWLCAAKKMSTIYISNKYLLCLKPIFP